ncbi:MAG: hypothetical protein FWF86_01545, partial [Clostridia bacterium]|nr:hypothetical protein [Clostridia bacterium]
EIYALMRKKRIRYFLSGGNWALESILQRGNTHTAMDVVNMRDIHRRFGEGRLNRLTFLSAYRRVWDQFALGIRSPRPLNYMEYHRARALEELRDFCGFKYYGGKHLENKLTAFTQLVWLPQKFGVDKRTSHLSSMIISGQITRQEALEVLDEPLYAQAMMMGYVKDIREKLEMPEAEYEALMAASPHEHSEYRIDPILRLALRLGLKPRKG